MKFAKIVFWIAGISGVLVLTPHYFMFDAIGRNDPPPITHPEFFYGFAGVALAWQVAFLFIATDPTRYRPLMIPSLLEKLTFVSTIVVLVLQNRLHTPALVAAAPDFLLAVLFLIAYFKTPPRLTSL